MGELQAGHNQIGRQGAIDEQRGAEKRRTQVFVSTGRPRVTVTVNSLWKLHTADAATIISVRS